MAQPFRVSIPHRLGQAEATRRLQSGLTLVRGHFAGKVNVIEEVWTDSHLAFHIGVLGQQAKGQIEVLDDAAHLTVDLPWVLQLMAEKVKGMIEKQGQILLEDKSKR